MNYVFSLQEVQHNCQLHRISFCADDKTDKRIFTFICKDSESNKHLCYVFDSEKCVRWYIFINQCLSCVAIAEAVLWWLSCIVVFRVEISIRFKKYLLFFEVMLWTVNTCMFTYSILNTIPHLYRIVFIFRIFTF